VRQNNKAAHDWPREEIHALLAKVGEKNQEAFELLYRTYYSRVSNFLRSKLLGQMDDLASITQEVLYEVWRNPGAFNGQSQFTTFLFGIAKNKLLQHRDRERQRHQDLYIDTSYDEDESDPMDNLPSESLTPDMQMLEQEKMNVLHDCADKHLNALQRAVLLERIVFGRQIEEMAQSMERNAVTLRRAFQVGYTKVMACVQHRLDIKASKEKPDEA
jgi:RNA polymerase sigma-70 factor (ECF subfamily)